MPIVQNPAIAQGIANLSKLFAPPSGAEAAGWALANERNAKASRDAAAYERMTAEGATPALVDQFAIASGAYTPAQSYHAVDVESSDRRYGTDRSFEASRLNNADDNARAIATNGADNSRALNQTKLTELGKFFGTVSKDQIRPEVPSWLVQEFGGPAGDLPVVQGNRSAPTEAEVKGAILSGMPMDDQRATVLGDIPVEQIVMDDGKTPQFVRRNDAVGRQPYIDPKTAPKATNGLAVLADGTRVPALQTADGRWANAQTGAVLPDDVQIFDTPKPQGTAQEVGVPGKSTEFSEKNGMFAARAGPANQILNQSLSEGYQPSMGDFELNFGKAGEWLPASAGNKLMTDAGRRFYSNAQNFMMGVLRPDTGAAFGRDEFLNYSRIFIPMPGDDPKTLLDKQNARATALAALTGSSRGSAEAITQIMASQGLPVPPEMMARMKQNATTGAGGTVTPGAPPAAAVAPEGASPRRLKFNPATGGFE